MSKQILNQDVLKLNKHWQVIGICSVREAFEDMAAGAVTALQCDDSNLIPLKMVDWMKLEVRDTDDYINTIKQKVRVPRVVITVSFDKLFIRPPKLTLRNLRIRDKDTCFYTGKKLKPSEMSIEHVTPLSKNGKNIWENVALAHRDINSKRGNKDLEEVGLVPRFKPFAPRGRKPAEVIENKDRHPEWDIFLKTPTNYE